MTLESETFQIDLATSYHFQELFECLKIVVSMEVYVLEDAVAT